MNDYGSFWVNPSDIGEREEYARCRVTVAWLMNYANGRPVGELRFHKGFVTSIDYDDRVIIGGEAPGSVEGVLQKRPCSNEGAVLFWQCTSKPLLYKGTGSIALTS